MDKEFISFDVKTGMKNIIGRDLITDDFIAIYELVKNSYDAYADHVSLTFSSDEIIISDNGKGMSKSDLKEKWFAVAYSAKKDGTEDSNLKRHSHLDNLKSRRYYAGAKGVGRFSCDRLGNNLELITTNEWSYKTFKILVDWKQFEIDSKQSFGDIKIPIEELNSKVLYTTNKAHGTLLKISNLNSLWSDTKLIQLKRSLEKLINPFSNNSEFKIEIIANDLVKSDEERTPYQRINGIISNSILKVLDIKTTQVNVSASVEKISTKLVDRGVLIYHIEEPNHYNIIKDLDISLYFLNRSAKINFGKIMDIEPVNYGNVFLFKNGFRVQPYGNVGDDSWEIDRRKQQGYNRFLGTRDLFGKVDLITDDFNEFKEVSSRDGGLVETNGKEILFELFYEKALKRLERYVVGVLWGEGFKRKNYFINEEIAEQLRGDLKNDKDNDSYEDIKSNIGSKIDFVNLIKSLSDDNDIKIINYNKELVDFVNEKLNIVQPKFIVELERIAEKTNDEYLINQVKLTEENFNRIINEIEEAERKIKEEELRRIEAEKKAEEEERKRIEAEKKQKEEEEKRRKAELETLKKEKERAEAELAKIKAEQKAKEESEKREEEEKARKKAESDYETEKQQTKYLLATRNVSEEVMDLVHSIKISAQDMSSSIRAIFEIMNSDDFSKDLLVRELEFLKFNIDRSKLLSEFVLKADIKNLKEKTWIDIPQYISEYIQNYNIGLGSKFSIKCVNLSVKFRSQISILDISIILDNLISNSRKAGANNMEIAFSINTENFLKIDISDNGDGLSAEFLNKPESIFKLGITNKNGGSGIGLHTLRELIIENLHGNIQYTGTGISNKGATFTIILK